MLQTAPLGLLSAARPGTRTGRLGSLAGILSRRRGADHEQRCGYCKTAAITLQPRRVARWGGRAKILLFRWPSARFVNVRWLGSLLADWLILEAL